MAFAIGITEERDVKEMPGVAGAAIALNRILQAGTLGNEVIEATAATQYPEGVSGNAAELPSKATYEEGDSVAIKYAGIAYVSMSGSGSRDGRVVATTAGQGLAHTTADNVYVFGHAMQDWADGDIIPVRIGQYYIGDQLET